MSHPDDHPLPPPPRHVLSAALIVSKKACTIFLIATEWTQCFFPTPDHAAVSFFVGTPTQSCLLVHAFAKTVCPFSGFPAPSRGPFLPWVLASSLPDPAWSVLPYLLKFSVHFCDVFSMTVRFPVFHAKLLPLLTRFSLESTLSPLGAPLCVTSPGVSLVPLRRRFPCFVFSLKRLFPTPIPRLWVST